MPDREKVIMGLYLCEWTSAGRYDGYEPDYESCLKCPYRLDDFEPDVCCADLMRDALELLKEHEPRVLTLEEAKKAEVCWLEQRGYEPYVTDDADTWNPEIYGKAYRCWSAMPTDEQRKAVKWGE